MTRDPQRKEAGRTAYYTARVTSKGQITLPAELRRALGIEPGDFDGPIEEAMSDHADEMIRRMREGSA